MAAKCTKVIDKLDCGKPAVLQVNDDYACEEHAPELAELSDVEWPITEVANGR